MLYGRREALQAVPGNASRLLGCFHGGLRFRTAGSPIHTAG